MHRQVRPGFGDRPDHLGQGPGLQSWQCQVSKRGRDWQPRRAAELGHGRASAREPLPQADTAGPAFTTSNLRSVINPATLPVSAATCKPIYPTSTSR